MRTAPPFLHLAHDAAGDVVAGEQLRRAPGVAVALGIAPALFFVVGRLAAVVLRDVVEHEAAAILVAEHAALAAHAFGDQDAAHTRVATPCRSGWNWTNSMSCRSAPA